MAAYTPRHGAGTPARPALGDSVPGTVQRGASPSLSDGGAGSGDGGEPYYDEGYDGGDAGVVGGGAHNGAGGPDDDAARNFKVVIRVRPPLPRELHGERPFENAVHVQDDNAIVISENLAAYEEAGGAAAAGALGPYSSHTFTFDHVYDQGCDQRTVYETTAQAVVESSLKGYNATILAYGQTGTGKTYTMEGFNSAGERGIIPRAIEQIFRHIGSSVSPRMRFLVRASYLQIYNEVISDLLKPERSNLTIREDKKRGVYVEGLSEWVVRSPQEIYGLMERGGAVRATGATKLNEISSRSHAVFMIITEQSETTYVDDGGAEMSVSDFHALVKARVAAAGCNTEAGLKALEANVRQSFKVGKLNLVDLAGSERVRLTGATGQRLEESKKINQSLSALGNVIAALTDPRGRQHIPYRDSKLTRILEDSLGGNCKTTMMAMISPALESFHESLSTLKFANRAKSIRNEARVNEDVDQKSLLRQYERELKRLRSELEERSRVVVDQRRLLQLEEERRRAEEDKMAAIRALEARSREFMREKQEKKRLEDEINRLQESVLQGGLVDKLRGAASAGGPSPGAPGGGAGGGAATGGAVQDTPAFRNALKEHQERIRAEYEGRLAELERERNSIEEEKAQVDRYKQLLLKQRDIMILLTQRLNERDEQIVALQDELDAYDAHQRTLEEVLDDKTAALIHLQRVTMEHNASSPVKNVELVEALGDWAAGGDATGSGGLRARLQEAAPAGGSSAVPVPAGAGLLITTKQYRPHHSVPTSGSGGDSTSPLPSPGTTGAGAVPTGGLLSAEEKISELGRLVDGLRGERDRLVRDLEDTQAEKVSMEYLLREKLERLVQAEIEARLAAYNGGGAGAGAAAGRGGKPADPVAAVAMAGLAAAAAAGSSSNSSAAAPAAVRQLQADLQAREDELAAVRAENARADEEVTRLRRKLQQLSEQQTQAAAAAGGGGDGAESASLRERLAVHEKERRAIHTIMEHKIKALVDAIATAAASAAAAAAAGGSPTGAAAATAANSRLQREVQALQRLVNASIAALRNSETTAAGGAADGGSAAAAPPATPSARQLVQPASSAAPSSLLRGGSAAQLLPQSSAVPSTPGVGAGLPRPSSFTAGGPGASTSGRPPATIASTPVLSRR